jgi:hypothetical protein
MPDEDESGMTVLKVIKNSAIDSVKLGCAVFLGCLL